MTTGSIIDGAGMQAGLWSFDSRFADGFETPRASPRGFIRIHNISSVSDELTFDGLAESAIGQLTEFFLFAPSLQSMSGLAASCARSFGGVVHRNWPIIERSKQQCSALPVRLFRKAGNNWNLNGYGEELEATEVSSDIARTINDLQSRIECESEACAHECGFSQKYGTRRIMTVGSTSRGTYSGILVDFDLVIETRLPQAEIARDDIQHLVTAIVYRVLSSTEYASYCGMVGQLDAEGLPFTLNQSFFGVRGKESFVSRHEIVGREGNRHNLIDFTIGRLPQLVGYEIWIQRFLSSLDDEQRTRIRREIRLTKKLLAAMGGLYGVGTPGFRGNVVEQLIIQGWDYRCHDDSGIGSLSNSLMLIAEENQGSLDYMSFAEFKRRFPLWHPGWWEAEVGLSTSQPGVNILDLLGGGQSELAERQWGRVKALALSHSKVWERNLGWRVSAVVKRANELLIS